MKKTYTTKNILVLKSALVAAAVFVLGACGDAFDFAEGAPDVPPVKSAYMYFAKADDGEDICIVRWTLPEGSTKWYNGVLIYIWSNDMQGVVQAHETDVSLRSKSLTKDDLVPGTPESHRIYYLTVYTSNTAGELSRRFDWTYDFAAYNARLTYYANGGGGTARRTESLPARTAHTVAWPGTAGWTNFTPPVSPAGLSFTGWNTKEDGSGDYYIEGSAVRLEAGQTMSLFAVWANGVESPYLIWHQGDGAGGLQNISNGLDKNYKVAVNFTITPSYTAPGTYDAPFTGVFDGNGKTITWNAKSGLTPSFLFQDSGTDTYSAGVIAVLYGATIKNLVVSGYMWINSMGGVVCAGGIVGYASGSLTDPAPSEPAEIKNCHSSVNMGYVSSGQDANFTMGGIVGIIEYGEISNCYSTGDIKSLNAAGGIAGKFANGVTTEYCYAFGTITSTSSASYASGIAGTGQSAENAPIKIENCVALNGSVSAKADDDSGDAHRIICFDSESKEPVLTNNYGLQGMTGGTWQSDASGEDGADVTKENAATQSWWTTDGPKWTIVNSASDAKEDAPWVWNTDASRPPVLYFEAE